MPAMTCTDTTLQWPCTWAAQPDWPSIETFLQDNTDKLLQPHVHKTLTILMEIQPDNPTLAHQHSFLREVKARGLDTVLNEGRTHHERALLLTEWISTTTWSDSATFLAEHHDRIATPECIYLLSQQENGSAQQHAAILMLVQDEPIDQVYGLVTDQAAALNAAMASIQRGNLLHLGLITAVNPPTSRHPLVAAVLALGYDELNEARRHLQALIDNGSETQRQAAAIRLRDFRQHHPELATGTNDLIRLLDP